jgi:aarF domain-containing kinase
MKRLAKLLSGVTAVTAVGVAVTYPELRQDAWQLAAAGKRFGRITKTAVAMGYDYLGEITHEKHLRNGQRLYHALKDNGGAFIKCGQVIAQLDIMVPEEYSDAMKPMFAEAPRSSFEDVRTTIEEDLGMPLEAAFIEFDVEPVASASLAQVHRAVLADGTEVAVKVQHRWIKRQYPGDAKVLEFLVRTGKLFFPDFDYMWIVEDLELSMAQELDFTLEAKNALKCRQIFENDSQVEVPKIYLDFSTERVLTMEFSRGLPLTDLKAVKEAGLSFKDLAQTLTYAFNEMVFSHGFVHCDPHPGNLLVKPVKTRWGTKAKIVLLDHGLYRQLKPEFLESYTGMWRSILTRDQDNMRLRAIELGVTELFPLLASMMTGRSWDDIMATKTEGLQKLRNPRAFDEDKKQLKKNALAWRTEINFILRQVHNDFLLLFKTLEWLRALDASLGAPASQIQSIADYCTRQHTSTFQRWLIRFKVWLLGLYYALTSFLTV